MSDSNSPAAGGGTRPGATPRVPALLVGHADFARSMLAVACAIAGPVDDIPCLSNEGRSPEDLAAEIRAGLDRLGLPALVLVDVANGSCFAAARRASRGLRDAHLVTGVNLPLLLTYLQNRDRMPAERLVAHALDRGHAGMVRHQEGEGA